MLFFKRQTAQDHYKKAIELYQKGMPKKALKPLLKAEALEPDFSDVFYTRGLCYEQLNDMGEAKKAYQHALFLNPSDADCLHNLARLYYEENDVDIALAYAEQAYELVQASGGDEQINYLLGLIHEQANNIPEAIKYYEESIALNPEQFLGSVFLAHLFVKQQDYPRAIELFKRLAETDPNNVEIHYEVALCMAKTGDWEGTIKFCRQVIELDENHTKAYNQLGLALYCIGRLDESIKNYEKALTLDPEYSTAINNLAYALEKNNQLDKAIERFTQYLKYTEGRPAEKAEIEDHIMALRKKKKKK